MSHDPGAGVDPGLLPPPEDRVEVDRQVRTFLAAVSGATGSTTSYADLAQRLASLGDRDLRASATLGGRMLARPPLSDDGGDIGNLLDELGNLARSLQRDMPGASPGPRRRLIGLLPRSDPVVTFARRSAQALEDADSVVVRLRQAQQSLRSENAAIHQDVTAVRIQAAALRRHAYMAAEIDTALSSVDVPAEVLFALRQRRRDLLTQLAIAVHGEAALGVLEANNAELVRAIEDAATTTSAALRTSVVAVQAMLAGRVVRQRLGRARNARQAAASGAAGTIEELKVAWAGVDAAVTQAHDLRARIPGHLLTMT